MEIPGYVNRTLNALVSDGYQAFIVGGAVRDIVRGKTPDDFDLCTSAMPEETIVALKKAGINYVDNAKKHGTIMAIIDKQKVEITTFRIDGEYKDSRRPESVKFTRSIEEDVKRRDFTINSLYVDNNGNITDLTGGIKDIDDKLIRAVGDPETRFREDALRIMRGLRFSAQFGFEIETKTLEAMKKTKNLLKNISGERIQAEFSKLIVAPFASDVIRDSVDILSVFVPELKACEHFDQKSLYHNLDVLEHTLKVIDGIPLTDGKRILPIALAAFFHDISKPACFYMEDGRGHMKGHPEKSREVASRVLNELKYSNDTRKEVEELVRYHDTFVRPTRQRVHKFMCGHPIEFFEHLEILQRADILAHSEIGMTRLAKLETLVQISKELIRDGKVFRIQDLDISGDDIISLGIKPGPLIGEVMNALFDEYVEGIVDNNKEKLMERAKLHVTKC